MALRLLSIIILIAAAPSSWGEAYYWVDENGKRHYSDRVPPKESKRERKVIDERGYTVKTLPKEKTAAEIQAESDAAKAEQNAKQQASKERAEQAAYDRLLLTTYNSVDDIKHARDDRLGLLDAGILVEEQAQADNHKRLEKLTAQETTLLETGKPVPNKLKQNIRETKNRITTNERNIIELKRQRADIETKFNQDIKRYNELTLAAGANN